MTSAVLYGTTSDNELRPVQVTDSGEFVTDGGGGGDWYENFYVGGTEGAPSISLSSNGNITAAGTITGNSGSVAGVIGGSFQSNDASDGAPAVQARQFTAGGTVYQGRKSNGSITFSVKDDGTITTVTDIYCRTLYQSAGYDLQKIGMALSTIHDVLESVEDLQGLKNLFLQYLFNLKTDPSPPMPPPPSE